jgi:hypothetical protein
MPFGIDDVAVIAAIGYIGLGESPVSNPSNFRNPFDEDGDGNIWPLSKYADGTGYIYNPTISSGWGSPRQDALDKDENGKPKVRSHAGVDVMYKRRSVSDKTDIYRPGGPNGSKWFFIPEPFKRREGLSTKKCPVFAVADGILWSATEQGRGFAVVLDHGKPWATFYHHLTGSPFPITRKGEGARLVKQGDIVGFVGANPVQGANALKHLHFEIWKGGAGDNAIDPEPLMRRWRHHQ